MARTKKELKDQDPLLGSETADQTAGAGADGTGLVPGGEPGTPSPFDLELADGTPLDPNAPQTEMNQEPEGGQPPQADLEPGAEPPGLGEPTAVPQTGLEPAGDGTLEPGGAPEFPQTDLELLEGAEGRADEKAGSQTGSEVPDDEAAGESGPAASQTGSESPGDEAADESGSAASQTDSGQPKNRLKMPGRRGQRVVSIDAERTVETDTDKLRSDLLDLVESLKGKKILTGTIQGVERLADNPEMSYAVTYHGDYKVIIPVLEAVEEPEDYRGQPKGDVLHYLLNKRLGAEARVVSVIRAGIFVDLFGAECCIPLRELSYQRWVDATAHYQSGQRVLVRVLEVDRSDRSRLRVSASVKQAGENPYEKALKKYAVGSLYVGTVSMVDTTGVFVSLDGGIDCLCTYPKRGRPPRGCRVSVRILGINYESNRIWGVITHMSTVR